MKSAHAIIIGAGIIGLSLALELRKSGMKVLVVERGQPGREASWAAGGMLADFPLEMPSALGELAAASAKMYPEFVNTLESDSGLEIDLRDEGTLVFLAPENRSLQRSHPLPLPLSDLEPYFTARDVPMIYLKERSVDPRHLTAAAIAAARNQGVDFSSDDAVQSIEIEAGKVVGIGTAKTRFKAGIVVNCAGAWSGQITLNGNVPRLDGRDTRLSIIVPTRPVKGQMLCVALPHKNLVRHVVRTGDVYLIPRSNGTMLIGATQEEAGFDKSTVPETILKLRNAAIDLVPKLAEAHILEDWAGLRPGTPDNLPILGATAMPGYYVATGHFRDGILLAPITARVMGQVIRGEKPEFDLAAFAVERFQT